MKYDFIVLGADGMQGTIVARDLLERGYTVFLADMYKTKITPLLQKYNHRRAFFTYIDLRDLGAVTKVIKKSGANVVINCAEMDWNANVYNACLATKTHCVDLGAWIEMTDKQLRMDAKFKKIKRTAITGCGSVPGIGNVMLRYAAKKFDKITSVDVGFAWDSNKKKFVVPFSMKSILEEFTYNPRLLKNGRWIEKKPLQVIREYKYRLIGRQKSFLVQHPELFTFYHYYKKQGLKNIRFFAGFPGHSLEKIYSLIDLGFHSEKPIKIESIKISPLELINPVLKGLRTPAGYTEKENLWVKIMGKKDKKSKTILMECLVPPLRGWEDAGCNIDTGFPAVIMAIMIKNNVIKEHGSFSPEGVVPEQSFFKELRKKKMSVYENGILIN